jgi:hypothetical protein
MPIIEHITMIAIYERNTTPLAPLIFECASVRRKYYWVKPHTKNAKPVHSFGEEFTIDVWCTKQFKRCVDATARGKERRLQQTNTWVEYRLGEAAYVR